MPQEPYSWDMAELARSVCGTLNRTFFFSASVSHSTDDSPALCASVLPPCAFALALSPSPSPFYLVAHFFHPSPSITPSTYPKSTKKMDDLYQFMTPIGDTPTPAQSKPPTTTDDTTTTTTSPSQDPPSSSTSPSTARSSWSTWGASAAWGASLNKFIERGKKDMNEFVDVTRKDLNELVQTVQAESSTTVASLSKKVEDLKKSTTLPASVSAVVEGIKQEITEAATGLSSHVQQQQQPREEQNKEGEQGEKDGEARKSTSQDATADNAGEDKASMPEGKAIVVEASTSTTTTSTATAPQTRAEKTASSGLSFASTASLFTAGANTLTQTLTSSTKDIGTSANQLFKKTLPAVAEKHLGEADQFLKSTTESLKSNGLIAEQYVNKLGSGVANFINSAVVISAPEEKEQTGRSKKML